MCRNDLSPFLWLLKLVPDFGDGKSPSRWLTHYRKPGLESGLVPWTNICAWGPALSLAPCSTLLSSFSPFSNFPHPAGPWYPSFPAQAPSSLVLQHDIWPPDHGGWHPQYPQAFVVLWVPAQAIITPLLWMKRPLPSLCPGLHRAGEWQASLEGPRGWVEGGGQGGNDDN